MPSQAIAVYLSLKGIDHLIGRLWCHSHRERESASFEYEQSWLTHPERFALEPALQLTEGAFHTQADQQLFGAIGDSAPDRWGRVLMRRAEAQRAHQQHEKARTLREADYLLGVNDETRQGALRFALPPEQSFLSPSHRHSIPPLIELPQLLSASQHFLDHEETAQELKLLLAPGSSLGGARPKASVYTQQGHLAIAKFPRQDDDINVVLWEAVALTLAQQAGLCTPVWHLETVLHKPALIIERFDRQGALRIPFLSAMSMLGARDNEPHSYLEIADALSQYGGQPDLDKAELWHRIVFSILISNTDDHLRNHGFLYEQGKGWRLSPVYDLNPTPITLKTRHLTTAIDDHDHSASLDLALSVADHFNLAHTTAQQMIKATTKVTAQWRSVARKVGLTKPELEHMASAFEHSESAL